jgi:uroporphyrinogen-III synthase
MTGDSPRRPAAGRASGPLSGWRVVVTRARAQASELGRLLTEAGAVSIEVPVIEIADPADGGVALREALSRIDTFDWVVFTSVNAVERCLGGPRSGPKLGRARVAAVGPGTASALGARGIETDLVPDRYVAEALAEAFPLPAQPGIGGVLLPCSAGARDVVAEGLRAKGWQVEVVEAYRTLRPILPAGTAGALENADVITFASSSAVTGCLELSGRDHLPPVVACIGPITAQTAVEAGLSVEVVARVHTTEGLVQALIEWAAGRLGSGEQG